MDFRRLLLLCSLLIYSLFAQAQLSNSALRQHLPVESSDANEIRIGLYAFGFSKNNEYFNKIADGYTLFGYHLNPKLLYYPAPFVRLEAGVFLWKDFGNSGYQDIAPTFTARIQRENWALLFGTLEGNLNHGYIEPLYDFERVITNRLENGLQYQLATHAVALDAWVDWNHMLYRGEDDQEKINGGAALSVLLLERLGRESLGDTLRLSLPLQFTAQHKGGQIDASDLPLTTLAHAAVGLELEKRFKRKVLRRLYTKNYLVGYKDFSNEYQLPYRQGAGVYLNAGVDTKYQDVMLSYWQGDGYIAELGGEALPIGLYCLQVPGLPPGGAPPPDFAPDEGLRDPRQPVPDAAPGACRGPGLPQAGVLQRLLPYFRHRVLRGEAGQVTGDI